MRVSDLLKPENVAADLRVANKARVLDVRETTDADALYAVLAEPGIG